MIRTVTGDIRPAALGICSAHEHLLGRPHDPAADEDLCLTDERAATAELAGFSAAGGRALVEMSPADYGRDAAGLARLAHASGVQIICTTGNHKEAISRRQVGDDSIGALAERYIRDIVVGIGDTGVRAGVIKAGSSHEVITPLERRVFAAAALAHHATGAPISTHTEAGTMALEQIALFAAHGVAPQHLLIGHLDRRMHLPFLCAVADTGATIGFDQLGKPRYGTDEQRIAMLVQLCDHGYGRQVTLGGDHARRSSWACHGGATGLAHLPQRIMPALRAAGLADTTIDHLVRGNAARVLSFAR
jgi:phosphotriesterase-related protein